MQIKWKTGDPLTEKSYTVIKLNFPNKVFLRKFIRNIFEISKEIHISCNHQDTYEILF